MESLENRLVFSISGMFDHATGYVPAPSGTDFAPTTDGAVVEKGAESAEIRILDNDFRSPYIWPRIDYSLHRSSSNQDLSRSDIVDTLEISQPENGSATILDDGVVGYTPNDGFAGIDHFTYSVSHNGESHQIDVYVNVVAPILALQDWFHVDEVDRPNVLDVLKNDGWNASFSRYPSGDDSELRIVDVTTTTQAANVEISADGKHLVYTPSEGANGLDSFQYTVRNSAGDESVGIVEVQVTTIATESPNQTWPEQIEQLFLEAAVNRHQGWFGSFGTAQTNHYYWNDHPVLFDDVWEFQLDTGLSSASLSASQQIDSRDSVPGEFLDSFQSDNDQESDVDEGNLAQTDGNYLYSIYRPDTGFPVSQLVITDVRDSSELSIVARYDLDSSIKQIHLSDGRATLISQDDDSVTLTVLDVSDPTAPEFSYSSTIKGRLNQSRMVGDVVYVISDLSDSQTRPELETVCFAGDVGCFRETVAQYVNRVSSLIEATVFADVETTDANGNTTVFRSEQSPSLLRLDDDFNVLQSTVFSFDVSVDTDAVLDAETFVHGGLDNIYVSSNSVYLLQNSWSSMSDDRIELETRIEKVSFDASGQLDHSGSGTVPGHTLNQFSVSEHDDDLRIATQNNEGNHLFVLQHSDDQLEIVGSVQDLAQGERIYSVRFDGDRGYVVTFRQADPLFVFDLSDSSAPELMGELKISGYSNYMHVIDENHVLGIGREADSSGRYQEMQVSLFDVSDPQNPVLKHRYSFEGGRDLWSPLLNGPRSLGDHQSVSYFESHQTLVIPFYHQGRNWWAAQNSNGDPDYSMRVLDIDIVDGITELGNLHFHDSSNAGQARSLRVGDVLLGVSPNVVQAAPLRAPNYLLDTLGLGEPIDPSDNQQGNVNHSSVSSSVAASAWHNTERPLDVDNDGVIELSDMLRVINFLDRHGVHQTAAPTPSSQSQVARSGNASEASNATADLVDAALVDINNDGIVSPMDALQLLNHFKRQSDLAFNQDTAAMNTVTANTVATTSQNRPISPPQDGSDPVDADVGALF